MFTAPRLLTGPEALLLTASAALAGALLVGRMRAWPTHGSRIAAALAGALAASSLAAAPVTAWAIVSDLRAAKRLSAPAAARRGVVENGVDATLLDRAAALIPERDTYAVVLSARLDPDRAIVFRLWSLTAMLPRIAVVNPRTADWIVSWGVAAPSLGVRVRDVRILRPRQGSGAPVYVARVVR